MLEHAGTCWMRFENKALPRMRSFPAGLILPENVLEHAGTCWMRFEKVLEHAGTCWMRFENDPRAGRGAFST